MVNVRRFVRRLVHHFVMSVSVKSPTQLPFADDRILLNLAAYWSARRNGQVLPQRSDIDPLDMPRRLLPHLVLAEPAGGSDGAIRFRLVGTELVKRIGRDATGKTKDRQSVVTGKSVSVRVEPG